MTAPLLAEQAAELDKRRLQMVAEQAAGLRWQILLTAAIVSGIPWSAAPAYLLGAWFVGVIASREIRATMLARMAADDSTPIASRLRRTVAWNAVIGIANGSASLFMFWLNPTLDAVLTMIVVSWGAGAVSTSATVFPAFLAYATPVFVPAAAIWAWQGGWLGLGVAALVLMFFGVQIRFARRNLETFEESFRIRLENQALARSLALERTELAIARDAAVKANREKSGFLAAASHDLRQPLQALALNCDALVRMPIDPEPRLIARDIGDSVEELRRMLDALLDISKLDGGGVVARPRGVSLEPMIEGIAKAFRAAAAARGIDLLWSCPGGLTVETDPDLLRRILSNLVDNAIKFTTAGRVELHVTGGDGGAVMTVADTGPGIAAEDHARIFEDLVQLDSAGGQRAQGHGLGLGIVRRLATLLGITIALDSSVGTGARFRLSMPAGAAIPAPDVALTSVIDLTGWRILVVEDEAPLRAAYRNALQALGCVVDLAEDGAGALALFADGGRHDGVLADYRLRDGHDGLAVVDALRARRAGLAAVLVTAEPEPHVVREAHSRDIPVLRKPVDALTLGRTLRERLLAAGDSRGHVDRAREEVR